MLRAITQDISLYRNAYLLTFCASMGQILTGWDFGIAGGILALQSFQQYFRIDKISAAERADLSGNIAGILYLGSLSGSFIGAYILGRFGRKPCMLASAVIHSIGSLIQCIVGIGSTPEVGLRILYLGRFLCGFGEGFLACGLYTYISESVPAEIRGRCISAGLIATDIGLMLSYWVNYGVSQHVHLGEMQWRIPFIVQIIPGILFAAAMSFQHESPRWLIEQQEYDAAAMSLAFTARTVPSDEKITSTIEIIRLNISDRGKLSLPAQFKGTVESRSTALRCFIPWLIMIFSTFSGTSAVNVFAPQIFNSLGVNSTTSGLLATGVYGVVKVIAAAVCTAFVVERIGRKYGLIISGMGQGITMLWIGGYSAIHRSGKADPAGYVSIVAIYLYAIFFSVGWGTIAFAVAAEVPPYHLRPAVSSIAGSLLCLCMFTTAKITPILFNEITYGTYIFYGVICVVMALWAYVFLPESKGYELEDIKYLFEQDVILRSLQDSPGGWLFIGKRRAESVESLRIQGERRRKHLEGNTERKLADVLDNFETKC